MPATIRECVDEALTVIGEVAGVGVQQYTEDIVFKGVVRGFNLLFKKYPWPNYCQWFNVTLDGTTGVITTDAFTQVLDFEDFISVNREGEEKSLPRWPNTRNPSVLSSGTRPRFFDSLPVTHANYVGRKLKIYPVTAIGDLDVRAKVYPLEPPAENFDWEDTFYLDKDLLAYAGAYSVLIGNDLNPSAAEVAKAFMDGKFKDIMAALADHETPVTGDNGVPDQWYTRP